jgi:hypothetical protein
VKLGEFSNWEAPGSITQHDRENEALLAGKRYQARLFEEIEKSKLKELILDSAKHTTMSRTPGLSTFDEAKSADRFKQSESMGPGWTRTFGGVMRLNRKDNCQAVREGLQVMAEKRIEEYGRVNHGTRKILSPGRNKPPPMGALRRFPTREGFNYHVPQYQLDLPITTELSDLFSDDPDVWRRREYD